MLIPPDFNELSKYLGKNVKVEGIVIKKDGPNHYPIITVVSITL